jgi:hypothetical protein
MEAFTLIRDDLSQAWRNLEEMLKGTRGGKHGKRCFIKMNGGLIRILFPIQIRLKVLPRMSVFS